MICRGKRAHVRQAIQTIESTLSVKQALAVGSQFPLLISSLTVPAEPNHPVVCVKCNATMDVSQIRVLFTSFFTHTPTSPCNDLGSSSPLRASGLTALQSNGPWQ